MRFVQSRVPAVIHVVEECQGAMLLCRLQQSSDMTVVAARRSVTSTVVSVGTKEGRGYLRSLFRRFDKDRVDILW